MHQDKGQPVQSQQLPSCEVCHLQPTPESVQHIPFLILEIMLLFYSLKLAAAMFLVGYCFSKNCWYCPQCRREIVVEFQVQGSSQNLVIRIGNCMMMLTRIKFRIVAGIIIAYLLFSFITSYKGAPRYKIEKSWENLATNCGYQVFMENSFKANTMYTQYPRLGEWTIEGIFLRETPNLQAKITRMYIKMDPTQFKNSNTEDIVVYQTEHTISDYNQRQIGDLVRFSGQWEGREGEGHEFRFIATKIERTGQKADPNKVRVLRGIEKFISLHHLQFQHFKGNSSINNPSGESK